jgi:hypothetical protein
MGINLAITEESWGADSKDWLATRKGFDTARSITLNLALFTEALGFETFIPSGTVVGKVTASGLYGPYDPDGADGRQTAEFHLLNAVSLTNHAGGVSTYRAGATGLWEGVVIESKLPVFGAGEGDIDAAAKVELKFIRYE